MKNSQVLAKINELILEEGGRQVTLEGQVSDCELDNIGMIMLLLALEEEFDIFDTTRVDRDIDICRGCSVRELVQKCRLSLIES